MSDSTCGSHSISMSSSIAEVDRLGLPSTTDQLCNLQSVSFPVCKVEVIITHVSQGRYEDSVSSDAEALSRAPESVASAQQMGTLNIHPQWIEGLLCANVLRAGGARITVSASGTCRQSGGQAAMPWWNTVETSRGCADNC